VTTKHADLIEMPQWRDHPSLATSYVTPLPFLPDWPTFQSRLRHPRQELGSRAVCACDDPDVGGVINLLVVAALQSPELKSKLRAIGLLPDRHLGARTGAHQKRMSLVVVAPAVMRVCRHPGA